MLLPDAMSTQPSTSGKTEGMVNISSDFNAPVRELFECFTVPQKLMAYTQSKAQVNKILTNACLPMWEGGRESGNLASVGRGPASLSERVLAIFGQSGICQIPDRPGSRSLTVLYCFFNCIYWRSKSLVLVMMHLFGSGGHESRRRRLLVRRLYHGVRGGMRCG